jgi:hypothetical protein
LGIALKKVLAGIVMGPSALQIRTKGTGACLIAAA